jgi:surface-anchored protein
MNWAFSAPGVYQVGLKVSGTLIAGNQTISSDPSILTFLIEDGGIGPTLTAQLISNGTEIQIGWQSRTGVSYQLQSRAALESGNWTNEGPPIPGDGGRQIVNAQKSNEHLQFFRLLELQP